MKLLPMLNISKRVSQAREIIRKEKPGVFLFQFIAWLLYILEGKFLAYLVGWKKSYLGRGSRVIGTRFIKMHGRVSIGRYAWIEVVSDGTDRKDLPAITFGSGFFASERLHISAISSVELGDNCLFGSGVYISDHNHGSYKGLQHSSPDVPPIDRELVSHGPVMISSNVWVGDNVIILGPVHIGHGVVIGANSVVTRNVPDNVIVAGCPARIIKKFNHKTNQWEVLE